MDAAFPSITAPRLVVSGLSGGGGKTAEEQRRPAEPVESGCDDAGLRVPESNVLGHAVSRKRKGKESLPSLNIPSRSRQSGDGRERRGGKLPRNR